MKRAYFCKFFALILVLSFGLTGCKKGPKGLTPIPGRSGSGIPGVSPIGSNGSGTEKVPVVPVDPGNDRSNLPTTDGRTSMGTKYNLEDYDPDRSQFRERTVYFDLDKYTIKSSEQSKIQVVASFLSSESKTMVEIEGHCDERGTAEYNRSLGERRAQAIREYLISLGIAGERIHTISFGEDRPADPGHSEVSWSKNRRGEFILLRPKN